MGKLKKGKHAQREKEVRDRFAKMSMEVSMALATKHGSAPALKMLADLEVLEKTYDLGVVDFRDCGHRALVLELALRNRFRVLEMYVGVKGCLPPKAMIMEVFEEDKNPIHTDQQYKNAIAGFNYTNKSIFIKNIEWSALYVNDITGTPVGFIVYRLQRAHIPLCHVEHICVDAIHRGVGFARALIRRLEIFVKFFALHRPDTVMTVRANKESLSLWRGFGFTEPENIQDLPCTFSKQNWLHTDIFLVKYPIIL